MEKSENSEDLELRSKTSLRLKYEAEVEILTKQMGDLEDVRQRLGLSRRKICQLLLVDPSAWSRWTKSGGQAPPHIYRSLHWYLALVDKHPSWHPQSLFNRNFGGATSHQIKELRSEVEERLQKGLAQGNQGAEDIQYSIDSINLQLAEILGQNESREQVGAGWKLLLMLNTCIIAALCIKWIL